MAALSPGTNVEKVYLFNGLSERQLDWVRARLHRQVYPAGANIITAEQPGEVVYLILSGTVKIHRVQVDGTDVILAILGSGELVGEMSLLDSAGRSASVVALEDSVLLWMSADNFQRCLNDIPQISRNLVQIFSSRLRLANEQIQALASLNVYGRVARQLLAFAEKYGEHQMNGDPVRISIRLTQSDIADLVGASRKRVNQVVVTFKNQGFLTVDADSRITLHDFEGLASYCNER